MSETVTKPQEKQQQHDLPEGYAKASFLAYAKWFNELISEAKEDDVNPNDLVNDAIQQYLLLKKEREKGGKVLVEYPDGKFKILRSK